MSVDKPVKIKVVKDEPSVTKKSNFLKKGEKTQKLDARKNLKDSSDDIKYLKNITKRIDCWISKE